MTVSLPDICDQFSDEIVVFDPVFHDFGGKRKFCGEIMTVRCFEDNSLVGETVRSPGHDRVLVWTAEARCGAPCSAICWLPRPWKTAGRVW